MSDDGGYRAGHLMLDAVLGLGSSCVERQGGKGRKGRWEGRCRLWSRQSDVWGGGKSSNRLGGGQRTNGGGEGDMSVLMRKRGGQRDRRERGRGDRNFLHVVNRDHEQQQRVRRLSCLPRGVVRLVRIDVRHRW